MPRIRVYPDALRHKAYELRLVRDDQRQIMQDVSHIIEDLFGWEGEAQKAFMKAFERVKSVYERFAPDIDMFANYLENYSAKMEYIDINASQLFFRDSIINNRDVGS